MPAFTSILRHVGVCLVPVLALAAPPLSLHPQNPHYFLFRWKPTVLITSGEHYGAVLNGAFNYRKYLDTLAADGLNLTRVFSGLYRELPGESFNIASNTLAPEESDFIQPFRRIGPQRYDLSQWNDDYFQRWREFVAYAGERGIIVEVTLFTTYYNPKHWSLSPLNAANNTQGIGKVKSDEVLTLKEPGLVEVQEEFVRKLVTELKEYDNIYYEICNEPYFHGPTEEWQRRIARVIAGTEAKWRERHLISRNIANGSADVQNPDPLISIFNFHYARPPRAVAENYDLNKPVGLNETGFDGAADSVYRIQAWDFLLAGGALYNNLDYSFTAGKEDGTFRYPSTQPGGGSATLRRQLKTLRQFMDSLPFTAMRPDNGLLKADLLEDVSARALSDGESIWAMYIHGGKAMDGYNPKYVVYSRRRRIDLPLNLAAGNYEIQWWDPRRDAGPTPPQQLTHSGGTASVKTPEYSEDLAAIIRQTLTPHLRNVQ